MSTTHFHHERNNSSRGTTFWTYWTISISIQKGMTSQANQNDDPLPLCDLRERISPSTYQWIQEEEKKEKRALEEDEDEALQSCQLFHTIKDDDEEEEPIQRVRTWISSSTNVDGFGGYSTKDEQLIEKEDGAIQVKYILSDKAGGHGDDLWAASRYIANIFADSKKCCELINANDCESPLLNKSFLELGAGGGVPSWTAMKCGARVICTDQSIPDRIRCLAECAQRNLQDLEMEVKEMDAILQNAMKVSVCPFDWGTSPNEIISLLGRHEEASDVFDIILAADCIYIPQCHDVLLESIDRLLSKDGVALLPFALHGNTKDENVWNIFEKAKDREFQVEVMEKMQLTPQSMGMDKRRGLVNMVRMKKI